MSVGSNKVEGNQRARGWRGRRGGTLPPPVCVRPPPPLESVIYFCILTVFLTTRRLFFFFFSPPPPPSLLLHPPWSKRASPPTPTPRSPRPSPPRWTRSTCRSWRTGTSAGGTRSLARRATGEGEGGGGVRDPFKRGGLRTPHRRGRRWRRGARSGARGGASYFWGRAPSVFFLRAPPSAPCPPHPPRNLPRHVADILPRASVQAAGGAGARVGAGRAGFGQTQRASRAPGRGRQPTPPFPPKPFHLSRCTSAPMTTSTRSRSARWAG